MAHPLYDVKETAKDLHKRVLDVVTQTLRKPSSINPVEQQWVYREWKQKKGAILLDDLYRLSISNALYWSKNGAYGASHGLVLNRAIRASQDYFHWVPSMTAPLSLDTAFVGVSFRDALLRDLHATRSSCEQYASSDECFDLQSLLTTIDDTLRGETSSAH